MDNARSHFPHGFQRLWIPLWGMALSTSSPCGASQHFASSAALYAMPPLNCRVGSPVHRFGHVGSTRFITAPTQFGQINKC
ncbi:hypothetical protein HYQ46_011762 [Verticillium longisporum]|uniref:Uncharacterized protein n=1 Tax=Verticillium longisporum TaxID=100787 RepID=A0A0G4LW95_VERLO|nr:hypothetical protein HYQ46_011762 [Verticillium longisporum]CRK26351.1 hypothetical protein BN1708_014494 [Verticillium longisporum]